MNTTPVDALFARFRDLSLRAEDETKRYGTPSGETRMHLNTLNAIFDATEQHAAEDARQHATFVQALRRGYRSDDAPALKTLMDDGSDWHTLRRKDFLPDTPDAKAMVEADDTLGGFLASNQFARDLARELFEASPVRQVATVHLAGSLGEFLPIVSDIQTAVRVSESATRAPSSDGDLALSAAQVPVHEAMAFAAVSRHLVMDSKYPLEQELLRAARVAFAKLEGTEFIKGDGVGEFKGLDSMTLPAANVITSADSTGHKVAVVDIHKLLHETLNAEFLNGARLLLNRKTLGQIRQLNATSGAVPMFPVVDQPGTLAGVPYVLCPDMDEVGVASKNVVYLMHPSAYLVVQRQDVAVVRLVERYAEVGKIGFYLFIRSGGQPILPNGIAKIVTA